MKCTSISFLNSFYKSSNGESIAAKVSAHLLHDSELFRGNVVAYGFGSPYLDKIDNSNLYFAIPDSYPLYRWPKIRPFKTVAIDSEAQPFKSASFDVALVFHVFEFLGDQEKFLAEIRRVLKPNGILVIVLFNKYGFNSIFLKRKINYKNIRYTIDEISNILANNRFEVKNITGKNQNLNFWPENVSYFLTKYADSLALSLPAFADVSIIKAQKIDFATESIEVLVPEYGL